MKRKWVLNFFYNIFLSFLFSFFIILSEIYLCEYFIPINKINLVKLGVLIIFDVFGFMILAILRVKDLL
jgi:hypothetical protein